MKYLVLTGLIVSTLFATVDINNASKEKLMSIKGIGVKKAKAILKMREKYCFKSVEELIKVKGIGKRFIKKHKDELIAGKCK